MQTPERPESLPSGPSSTSAAWDELMEVVSRLRRECPWDGEQTPLSIARYVVQEAYELLDAASRDSWEDLCEEVGDLLFQMGMLLVMAEEKKAFQRERPLVSAKSKLIRRHPHVFGSSKAETSEEVEDLWKKIKEEEKQKPDRGAFRATGVATRDAAFLQRKAAEKGFDWSGPNGVLEKLEEERVEMIESLEREEDRRSEELGDLFFTMVNLARHLKVDPDEALANATRRFWRRFQVVERAMESADHPLSLEEMEACWQEAKKKEEGSER